MEKGISLFFGYNMSSEKRAELIKKYGFDSVITSGDKRFRKQNGSLRKQVKIIRERGLKLSTLHMSYIQSDLHYFWEEGKKGEKLKKDLIKDVKNAKKYGFRCVVVHLFGEYSQVGKQRLLAVLNVCQKCNIPLAIENIDDQKLFVKVFEEIKHPYMKFCYDSGHNNVFDKDFGYLEKYGDKLIAVHLHDNNGEEDYHTLNKFGSINWNLLGRKLAKHSKNLMSLDYEIFMKFGLDGTPPEDCLSQVKEQADRLEEIIENFKG